jgi:uncharacterized protein (TIGR03382 family)
MGGDRAGKPTAIFVAFLALGAWFTVARRRNRRAGIPGNAS